MAQKRGTLSLSKKRTIEIHRVAHYAFFIGLLIAIVAGIVGSRYKDVIEPDVLITTLVILGFIVGLFNLTAKETTPFLVAATALMLAGIVNLGLIPHVGPVIRIILSNIVVFVVPGAILVGLKAVWNLASD